MRSLDLLVELTPMECRVIGVLLEKEETTPDQYPLSLNGLTTGCNQKSNREPVVNLSETEVQSILDDLQEKRQVAEVQHGSRVAKYQHRFCNTQFGSLQLSAQQKAIICVLLLRGPQTPGELRTRSARLADFVNVTEVEKCLEDMAELNGEQLVQKLPREPGRRENRFAHCFSGEVELDISATENQSSAQHESADIQAILQRLTLLEQEVASLKHKLGED